MKLQNRIDLGIIFLENAVRVLKENGRMAIVLSNSIASIDTHKEARKWLIENMRIVAIIDLPSNIFAEAGVSPTIIIAYKPSKEKLNELRTANYQVFSKEIKKVGYEVKTKNKVKCFETQYKINPITFEKELNPDGSAMLDEAIPKLIERLKVFQSKKTSENSEQTTIINARLIDINSQLYNIVEAIATGCNKSAFTNKLSVLETQKVELESQMREIVISNAPLNINEEMLKKIISMFRQFVKEKNLIECKRLVNSFVEGVLVFKDHEEVTFKVTSSFCAQNDCFTIKTNEKIKTLFRRFKVA
jgi:type I restriction-modification system DNA methylase subunit